MNRRNFIRNAISGLFVVSQPKLIFDLAANTFRQPTIIEIPPFPGQIKIAKKLWEDNLFNQVLSESYFSKFMGSKEVCGAFSDLIIEGQGSINVNRVFKEIGVPDFQS